MDLSTAPAKKGVPCRNCGAERLSLYDLESDQLAVPDVTANDFRRVLEHATSSVAPEELERFVKWTAEFGEEGS